MKVIISNTVSLNGGDAAILLSIIELFRNTFGEDTEFVIYDSQAEIATRYYPNLVFRNLLYSQVCETNQIKSLGKSLSYLIRIINLIRLYLAAWCVKYKIEIFAKILVNSETLQDLNIYKSADIVVSTGGTYLIEKYSLIPRFFDYFITLLMQRPLVFYTQSMGPFNKSFNRKVFSKIFDQSLVILLRDELSRKYLDGLNIHGNNIHVSSDVVFSLAKESDLKQACSQTIPKGSALKIAISVRFWPHFKQYNSADGMKKYKESIALLTRHVVEEYQTEVTYISTCQGIDEYWTNDSEVAEEIVDSLSADIRKSVTVNKDFHTPKNLIAFLKSCDIVIATRMHMAILALSAGTPVLPIAYEFKTQELFRRLGLGEWVQDIEMIEPLSFKNVFDSYIKVLPEIQQEVFTKVMNERQQAASSIEIVKQACNERLKSKS